MSLPGGRPPAEPIRRKRDRAALTDAEIAALGRMAQKLDLGPHAGPLADPR